MIRTWVTLLYRGREIERRVYVNPRGCEYVRVHDKRLYIDKLKKDGRIVNRYQFGKSDEEDGREIAG